MENLETTLRVTYTLSFFMGVLFDTVVSDWITVKWCRLHRNPFPYGLRSREIGRNTLFSLMVEGGGGRWNLAFHPHPSVTIREHYQCLCPSDFLTLISPTVLWRGRRCRMVVSSDFQVNDLKEVGSCSDRKLFFNVLDDFPFFMS